MAQESPSATEPDPAAENPGSTPAARRVPRWAFGLLPLVALLVFSLPGWLDASAHGAGRTLSGVTLGHTSIASLTSAELAAKITAYAKGLAARKVGVKVGGKRFELEAERLGLHVDAERSARDALAIGREGGVFARALDHWRRKSTPREVRLVGALDGAALATALESWEVAAIVDRPSAGGIEVQGTTVKEVPPRGGHRIDAARARSLLFDAAAAPAARDVDLPLVAATAPLPPDAATAAAAEARSLVAGAITLTATDPPETLTLVPAELGAALTTEPDGQRLRLAFVPERLGKLFDAARTRVEREPVDAKFEVSATGAISIVPSRTGQRIDVDRLPATLLAAAKSSPRSAELPLVQRPEPALSTAQAEALGVRGLVSTFTTRHPCCEKRVHNIHRIADLLDGQVVLPGQTVSVNALVGPRTQKRGFVPAPTIEEGEMVDSIGGGISQFATTFFNALFHGGYDIIERQPHTYWFPRYPMGHEATLSWPKPDIIFKNDTAAGLLIKTSYTDTTITVRLYGDNGGRKVRAEVSGRQNVVPAPLEIIPNPHVPPDEEKVKEPGSIGWSVIVSRIVTFADGTKKEERRRVTYKSRPRRIELHPCRIPEGEKGYTGERCPVPESEEATTPGPVPEASP